MEKQLLYGVFFWCPFFALAYAVFVWTHAKTQNINAPNVEIRKEPANLIAYDHDGK